MLILAGGIVCLEMHQKRSNRGVTKQSLAELGSAGYIGLSCLLAVWKELCEPRILDFGA